MVWVDEELVGKIPASIAKGKPEREPGIRWIVGRELEEPPLSPYGAPTEEVEPGIYCYEIPAEALTDLPNDDIPEAKKAPRFEFTTDPSISAFNISPRIGDINIGSGGTLERASQDACKHDWRELRIGGGVLEACSRCLDIRERRPEETPPETQDEQSGIGLTEVEARNIRDAFSSWLPGAYTVRGNPYDGD